MPHRQVLCRPPRSLNSSPEGVTFHSLWHAERGNIVKRKRAGRPKGFHLPQSGVRLSPRPTRIEQVCWQRQRDIFAGVRAATDACDAPAKGRPRQGVCRLFGQAERHRRSDEGSTAFLRSAGATTPWPRITAWESYRRGRVRRGTMPRARPKSDSPRRTFLGGRAGRRSSALEGGALRSESGRKRHRAGS
jgi:hypothetical protein